MKSNFKLIFDQSFANSHKKQLLWLFSLMVIVTTFLLGISFVPGMYHVDTLTDSGHRFRDILFLLIDPGSASDNMSSFFVVLVALLGMIVFCGMFISVITNSLERRSELFLAGELRYNMHDHIVIIGYDETVPALIQSLADKDENAHTYFLVQTSLDVPSIHQQLVTKLSKRNESRVVIYSGELTISEDLLDLQLRNCKEIFIIGNMGVEARDAMNMDCLQKIADILGPRDSLLSCHIQFKDSELFSLLQYTDLSNHIAQSLRFLPYNYENVWAQRVLVTGKNYLPIEGVSGIQRDSSKHVHVIICGMNAMGAAMAKQVAHIAHYPNFKEADFMTRTTISFIDSDAHNQMLHFQRTMEGMFTLAGYRYWDAASGDHFSGIDWIDPTMNSSTSHLGPNFLDLQWEFIQGTTSTPFVREYLKLLAADKDTILSIIIPDECSETALHTATSLPGEMYSSSSVQQICVRQDENNAIVHLINQSHELAKSKFAKLYSFGQLDSFFEEEVVPEEFGKLVNAHYDEKIKTAKQCEQAWQNTSVANRWSSMYCANMRFTRLRMLGVNPQSLPAQKELLSMIENNIDDLSRVEHNRWTVEKLLVGFRPLTQMEENEVLSCPNADSMKRKKTSLKTSPYYAHLDICSLEHLQQVDAKTIEYDKNVLKALPQMLYT